MNDNYIYGVVYDNIFYSNRSKIKYKNIDNGIYKINMNEDDFKNTLDVADLDNAIKYFKKSSKIDIIRGISFHSGIIPENPVKYRKIPINVKDINCNEFEEIQVVMIKDTICYFLQTLYTQKSYALMDLKETIDEGKKASSIKGITPDIRIAYNIFLMEMIAKKEKEPEKQIKNMMSQNGAVVNYVKKRSNGWEVEWVMNSHVINTLLNHDFRVLEAGFCVSNWDMTQSATSLVNVLDDYCNEGSEIYKTRNS